MKINNYKEHIEEIAALFKDIDFAADNVTKNLPADRVEAFNKAFGKVENDYKILKENLNKIQEIFNKDKIEEKDEKEFIDQLLSIRTKINTLSNNQGNFHKFIKEKAFEEMHIEEIKKMYKLFDMSDFAREIFGRIDVIEAMEIITSANEEYNRAHEDYIKSKNEFTQKHKGEELVNIHKEYTDALLKVKNADEEKEKYNEFLEKKKNDLANLEKEMQKNVELLSRARNAKAVFEKQINEYDSYITRFEKYAPEFLNYIEVAEKKTKSLEDEVKSLTEIQSKKTKDYEDGAAALANFHINIKKDEYKAMYTFYNDGNKKKVQDYILNEKKLLDADMLEQAFASIMAIDSNLSVKEIPESIRTLMANLGVHIEDAANEMTKNNKDLKVRNIEDSVQKQIKNIKEKCLDIKGTLEKKDFKKDNKRKVFFDAVNKELTSYQSRAYEALTFDINLKAKVLSFNKHKLDAEAEKKNNYDRIISAVSVSLTDPKEQEVIKKSDVPKIKEVLEKFKSKRKEELDSEKQLIKDLDKEIKEQEVKKDKIERQEIPFYKKEIREKEANYGEKYNKLEDVYKKYKDLDKLHDKYILSRNKRMDAIGYYKHNSNKVKAYDIDIIPLNAKRLHERTTDAAKGHTNSSHYTAMEEALKAVSDIQIKKDMDTDTIKKRLIDLEAKTKAYQEAKAAQFVPGVFASTLRKTRLAYADSILTFAQTTLNNLEKSGPKQKEKLEEIYNDLNLKQDGTNRKNFKTFLESMQERGKRDDNFVKKSPEERKKELETKREELKGHKAAEDSLDYDKEKVPANTMNEREK